MDWIPAFAASIISFVINHFINDYRLKRIEEELNTFKTISERLARIEGKIDYITQKNN
jgi:uncharacterized membrane protein